MDHRDGGGMRAVNFNVATNSTTRIRPTAITTISMNNGPSHREDYRKNIIGGSAYRNATGIDFPGVSRTINDRFTSSVRSRDSLLSQEQTVAMPRIGNEVFKMEGVYTHAPPTDTHSMYSHAEDADNDSGICGTILTAISWVVVVLTLPFSLCVCFKVVQEYERAVIFRLGRLLSGGAKGPGIFFILPCIDCYARVDLRTRTYDVPPQEVLTKDSVTVSVDAVVYYRVSNATISVANVENAHHSTRLLAQTTLRNTLGTRPLHEILSDRDTISSTMQTTLDEATDAWGIKVERVEIKDVRLPVQLQRAMAAEAEAAREARAKVIAAEGEQKASRALREASEVIGDSPAALQLRYLQTLNTISAEKNSTIVFPLPIDLLTYFMKAKQAMD